MRRPRILISDDDPLVLRTLSTLAKRAGLEPIEDARQEAAALAREQRPDVILVDIHQPAGDGRNLLILLKEASETEGIEVFVMSGRPEAYTRTECLLLGALEFLPKPIDLEMFRHVAAVACTARDAELAVHGDPRVAQDPAAGRAESAERRASGQVRGGPRGQSVFPSTVA